MLLDCYRKCLFFDFNRCFQLITSHIPCYCDLRPFLIFNRRLLKKRQRWYRCLDAGYLSLKVFLLERFLHDILFESSNPQILRDFVGINSSEGSKLNTKGWALIILRLCRVSLWVMVSTISLFASRASIPSRGWEYAIHPIFGNECRCQNKWCGSISWLQVGNNLL